MNQVKVVSTEAAFTNDGVVFYSRSAGAPASEEAVREQERSSLSSFIDKLSGKSASFKNKLKNEIQNLSPLATAKDGSPTITSLRMAAGLTQAELARRVGQKQSNVSLIESGMRNNIERTSMKKFCEALECDMNTLDAALDNAIKMNDEYHNQQDMTHNFFEETLSKKSA